MGAGRSYHSRVISTDVIIVGAGPIGLEVAAAFKRIRVDYLQLDAKQIGFTVSWFTPQTRFFSSNDRIAIAGVPLQTVDQSKCTREEYLAYLRTVALLFDLKVRTYEPVVGIERVGGGFVLTTQATDGEQRYRCRRLVLATGGTAQPRRLNIPGEDLPHVTHRLDDPHTYFRRRVLIVGGKNSAIEAALRCHHAGAHVSLSYRRPALEARSVKYWLLPEINGLIDSRKMPAYFGAVPVEITASHVKLGDWSGGRASEGLRAVEAEAVLLMTGYVADMRLCKLAGVELKGECELPTYDARTMETNVPGVYLAGTVTGGTQDKYTVFIENGHIHVDRIVAAITGAPPPVTPEGEKAPES